MPIEYTLWHSVRNVSMWVLVGSMNMRRGTTSVEGSGYEGP